MARLTQIDFSGLARAERPREKLMARGPDALRDAELLALLLGYGTKGHPVLAVADAVVKRHGRTGLAVLNFEELNRQPGIGPAKAGVILAALELGRRLFQKPSLIPPTIDGPESVFKLTHDLCGYKKEHLVAFYLNAKNQVLKRETVSIGSLFSNAVHPREVFAPALEVSAAGIIVAHNHPSGDPEPSPQDQVLTARLVEAGKLLGIDVLDHLVIGRDSFVSFQGRHWI